MSVVSPLPPAFSIPSKVFLIGEYAVLGGHRALVAAVGPRFHARRKDLRDHVRSGASPVEEFEKSILESSGRIQDYEFHDPHHGRGGFGASSAEFLSSWKFNEGSAEDWKACWSSYRNRSPGSGADLASQFLGGLISFSLEPSARKLEPRFDLDRFLIFSATGQKNRKVRTHENLADLNAQDFFRKSETFLANLGALVEKAENALIEGSVSDFVMAVNQYAEFLAREGLEAEAARTDREALMKLPGVAAVKGSGALLADGVILVLDEKARESGQVARIVETAEARELVLLQNGLKLEQGVRVEKN